MNQLTEGIFTGIYRSGTWRRMVPNKESHSGTGSTVAATGVIRRALPGIIEQFHIGTVLDVPCGDFNWMRHVDLGVAKYIGADIVRELVDYNREKYTTQDRSFIHLDILADTLPPADLVICRDCLVHFCVADAQSALENIKRSGATYILTTTYTAKARLNHGLIPTGGWTPYALQRPPFNLPEPLMLLNEECRDAFPGFTDKCLGLWNVCDLPTRDTS